LPIRPYEKIAENVFFSALPFFAQISDPWNRVQHFARDYVNRMPKINQYKFDDQASLL
jgi:hypothetical protein